MKKILSFIIILVLVQVSPTVSQDSDPTLLPTDQGQTYTPFQDVEIIWETDTQVGKRAVLHPGKNVFENGGWKRVWDAQSLIDKTWEGKPLFSISINVEDPDYKLHFSDFNLTTAEAEVEILNSDKLNRGIPVKIDGLVQNTVAHTSLDQRTKVIFHDSGGIFGKTLSVGPQSLNVTIANNNTVVEDNIITALGSTINHGGTGGGVSMGKRSGISDEGRYLHRQNYWGDAQGKELTNFTFQFYIESNYGASHSVEGYNLTKFWQENNKTGTAGHTSNWDEAVSGTSWSGTDTARGSTLLFNTTDITTGKFTSVDIPVSFAQAWTDASALGHETGNNGFVMIDTRAEADSTRLDIRFSENSNVATRPNTVIEWTEAVDVCAYTSGNWDIQCSDNCVMNANVNGDSGATLHLNGTGTFTIDATTLHGFDKVHFNPSECTLHNINGGKLEIS